MRNSIVQSRTFRRIFWLSVIAVLVAGLAVTPRALRAQDTATQPAPAATQNSADAFQQAANEEKAEDDVYLLAPIIKSIARTTHTDTATASWIFVGINFLILALGIGVPLVRLFPRIMRRRTQMLQHDLEAARKETDEAKARLSAVEARLASLDDEIARYRAEVEQEMARDEVRIKALLEEEKARIVTGAEQEISSAAAQARRGLRTFAAELAVDRAAGQLKLTPETDQALIAEFIGGAGRGGQN